MKFLFLDIDGVLNDHEVQESGYNRIMFSRVVHLNKILRSIPDVQLVISSSWRYQILNKELTLTGFEYLLIATGIACRNRLHGYTGIDDCSVMPMPTTYTVHNEAEWDVYGRKTRAQQIQLYARSFGVEKYVVLDDLEMDVPNLLKTDSTIGLTDAIADEAIYMLTDWKPR